MSDTAQMSERELAEYYNRTEDLSGFDEAAAEPVQVRRDVTISVRFSADEIERVRAAADGSGEKVTAWIRAAALNAAARETAAAGIVEVEQTQLDQLFASVDALKSKGKSKGKRPRAGSR